VPGLRRGRGSSRPCVGPESHLSRLRLVARARHQGVLGLAIVVAGFAVSTVFWAYYMPIAATAVLLVSAALDLVLYYVVPDVTICYRCQSQFRGPGANPRGRFAPFDLAIGERYRQERLRVEQLRERPNPADSSPPA
jgi:hypothetical protein